MLNTRKVLIEKTKVNNLKTYRLWIEGYTRPMYVQAEEIQFVGSSIVFLANEEIIKITPQISTVVTLTIEEEKQQQEQINNNEH